MFPVTLEPSSRRRGRTLRDRFVRGLDLAVEFATLGEYGVEELPAAGCAEPGGHEETWLWPARAPRRGSLPRLPAAGGRRPRPLSAVRAGGRLACRDAALGGAS